MRLSVIIAFLVLACSGVPSGSAIKTIDVEGWDQLVDSLDQQLHVVNFWATWCAPCVAELPDFMEVNSSYEESEMKMILVSLDEPEALESAIPKMQEKLKLDVDLYLLDDPKKMNQWINQVDSSWSGAIPATVLYKNGSKVAFHEGKLGRPELERLIEQHL